MEKHSRNTTHSRNAAHSRGATHSRTATRTNTAKPTGGRRNQKNSGSKGQSYLIVMLISLALHIFSIVKFKISIIVAIYPFILIVASVMARNAKNKRLSNMICAISLIFICLIAIVSAITAK